MGYFDIEHVYLGKIDKELHGRLDDRSLAAEFTPRIDQLNGIDEMTAAIALITSSIIVLAPRTSTLDKSVSQELIARFTQQLVHRFRDYIPLIFNPQEHFLGDSAA